MYITKQTKVKNLPKGKYILKCDNYESKKEYYLIDGKLAENTVFNTAYDFAYNKRRLSCLKGLYKAYEIKEKNYELYNLNN